MRFTLPLLLFCGSLLPLPALLLGQAVPRQERPDSQPPSPYTVSPQGLMRAIDAKDERAVAALLKQGVEVNVLLKERDITPLMLAVDEDHFAIVKLLLERGAEVTARNSSGETVLHRAASYGKPEVLKLLLEHSGRDHIHILDEEKWMPLHRAAREAGIENIRLLLDHGAHVNARGAFRQTPLMEAVRGGSLENIRFLLERGADPTLEDTSGGTAMMLAVEGSQVEDEGFTLPRQIHLLRITELLLTKEDVRNAQGRRALRLAVESEHDHIATLLLKAGAPERGMEEARFLMAVEKGDIPTVERSLRSGVSVDVVSRSGHTALMTAAMSGQLPLVNRLLASGANINKRSRLGETPLLCAIEYPQIVRVLLAKGADVNGRVIQGKTVLMYTTGNLTVTKLLLDAGANIHFKDKNAETAFIHSVQRKGKPEFSQMLLDRGMRVNTPQGGKTPLLWAARCGKEEIVRLLLNRGANVRAKDGDGNTALHHAILYSSTSGYIRPIVEMLLNHSADINALNNAGETPLTHAIRKNHQLSNTDLVFLWKHGAVGDTTLPARVAP